MSLDKQIKDMAAKKVDALIDEASRAVANVIHTTPLLVPDVARLVSEHKTKTTYDKCVKAFADHISEDMLASLGKETDEDE